MNTRSIVIQKSSVRSEQLILLFHGMGARADGLMPFGQRLSSAVPGSSLVSGEIADLAAERLLGHVPKRMWDEALRTAQSLPRF